MQIPASPKLSHIIKHFIVYKPAAMLPLRFFSDGNPGMVLPLESGSLPFNAGKKLCKGEGIGYGIFDSYVDIPPPPSCGMMIVVLQPYGNRFISQGRTSKFDKTVCALAGIIGSEYSHNIQEELKKCNTIEEIIYKIETLLSSISHTLVDEDYIVLNGYNIMRETNGLTRIADISATLDVTERRFERSFDKITGVSPKKLNGIIQMNRYLKLLRKGQGTSLTTPALESGFYDQAHLNNRFRARTGTTPSRYLPYSDPIALNLYTKS